MTLQARRSASELLNAHVCMRALMFWPNHAHSPLIKEAMLYSLPVTLGDSMATTLQTVIMGWLFGKLVLGEKKSITTESQATESLPAANYFKKKM